MPHRISDPRARAEAQLRLSEERFRHIFENAAVGIAEVGLDGRFATVNDTLCAITGYGREELLQRTFQDITHPDDLEADVALASRLASGELQQYTMEKRYIRRDGSIVFVNMSGSALRDTSGAPLGFVAIIEDISERKAAEEALRRSEQRFRSVFQFAGTGIAITDLDGTFLQCNPAYEAIIGFTEAELRVVTFSELVHTDDRAANMRALAALRAGNVPHVEIENRYVRKDGTPVWVHKFVALLYDAAGRPANLMALVTDVTGQRQLNEAQQEAMRQKDAFIAVLAHELRNPLAPIRTAVALLNRVGPPEPLLERALGVIDRQVVHMSRLVDDLLDVSRLSRGELRLQRGPTRLASVIESALEQTQPTVSQQRQHVHVEGLDEPIELLDADAVRLTQVVGNLLDNAAKYSPPDTDIRLSVSREGGDVVIRVRDRGVGIPAEQLQRVFDLFAQTDSARAMGRGGLGIGLALARQLVMLHSGTITASSPGPGLGSDFVVRLPVLASAHPSPEPATVAAARAPIGRRVLVADDNVDAAEMLQVLFSNAGCDVRQVHDGESAVLETERFRPDVAILDIGMPGMDGYEACSRIRETAWGASMLIVALTGWGLEADRRRSARAGFDQHFVKPVDPMTLTTFVCDTLAARPRP